MRYIYVFWHLPIYSSQRLHTHTYIVPVVRVGERIFFGGRDPSFAVTLTLPTIITSVVVGAVIIN